jgi:NADH dehydrogenase FAD-containing subunit
MVRPSGVGDRVRPRVVILGGGFGGLTTAQHLRASPVDVLLVDRTNHHLFQPLLYQVAAAILSPGEIAAPIRQVLAGQSNATVLMNEAIGIDLARQEVRFRDPPEVERYDRLVVATGADQSYFGMEHLRRWAPGMKTLGEATAVRARILGAFEAAERDPGAIEREGLLTFVLVGAGPTGVEMAGAIAELRRFTLRHEFRHIDPRAARVILLDAGERILAGFDAGLAARAHRRLERLGVEVRVHARVEDVDATGARVDGALIRSRTVIWTAGVLPSPLAASLGASTDRVGRVQVEPGLTVPGDARVFVIGDLMTLEHHGQILPGVAQVAIQQGRYVANIIDRQARGHPPPPPFRYSDPGNLAVIGRGYALLDSRRLRLSGLPAWIVWATIHITYLTLFSNRLLVLVQWAWTYFTRQHGTRLIVKNPAPPAPPEAPAP